MSDITVKFDEGRLIQRFTGTNSILDGVTRNSLTSSSGGFVDGLDVDEAFGEEAVEELSAKACSCGESKVELFTLNLSLGSCHQGM